MPCVQRNGQSDVIALYANAQQGFAEEWLDEGHPSVTAFNTSPVPIPSLESWQFFAMLDLNGKQEALYAFIEALPHPQKAVAKAKLERSVVFYRDNDRKRQGHPV